MAHVLTGMGGRGTKVRFQGPLRPVYLKHGLSLYAAIGTVVHDAKSFYRTGLLAED